MIPQISTILNSVSMILMIMAIKVLVMIHRISCHLIRPLEERFVFNFLQDLLYWLSKYSIHRLSVGRCKLPSTVSPRSGVLDPIRPEIPSLLRDQLHLSFPLKLILLNLPILIIHIHHLMYTDNRFTSERFSQIMLDW